MDLSGSQCFTMKLAKALKNLEQKGRKTERKSERKKEKKKGWRKEEEKEGKKAGWTKEGRKEETVNTVQFNISLLFTPNEGSANNFL